MAAATTAQGSLSVIALISGGKDSFYSILHCQANGHHVVALANLYPSGTVGEANPRTGQHHIQTQPQTSHTHVRNDDGETDLNSFMYQTVGHQIISLYAQATGLPLHRQPIVGTAVHHGLSYESPRHDPHRLVASNSETLQPSDDHLSPAIHDLQGYNKRKPDDEEHEPELELELELELEDETESLVPLLRAVLKAHPEANALCTGAILSTYQRTRIESIALRLGLVPLSYLWQYTELPTSVSSSCYEQGISLAERVTGSSRDARKRARKTAQNPTRDDAQLLRDMAAVGLEARIVKVASAGLDEDFLWENVASEVGVQRVERAMRRFGVSGGRGSILGEGGEFETLVVDGPPSLFKGRIVVSDGNKRVIREGGGCAWLSFRRADIVLKDEPEQGSHLSNLVDVRRPELLNPRFEDALQCLLALTAGDKQELGFVDPSSCDDNTKPTLNLGSTSSSYSITATDLPRCELPLSPQSSSSQEWHYLGSSGAESLTIEEQTVSIVDRIQHRLDERGLPATAITNSVIVLRQMSDFPLVNEHYGSLFSKPNPPSRVTISCGDGLLPKDAAVAVYLTVQLSLQPYERRGLHVQSRSYWAPANIGPYSQAIAFPLLSGPAAEMVTDGDGEDKFKLQEHSEPSSSPLAVSIAGQIPLLPASMALPPSSTSYHVELQITLALQHLWRVGIEMQVRWWTSAVAYFPATLSAKVMQHHVLLAAAAWRAAHLWPDLENGDQDNDEHDISDEDDAGPDLWDRRYNAQFMTYGASNEEESFPLSLPNWSVLKGLDAHEDNDNADVLLKYRVAKIPFFFAAEVEELPRQAGVEWHAHLGFAELQPGYVTLFSTICDKIPSPELGLLDLELHHVFVDSGDAVFTQTTAALRSPVSHDEGQKALISAEVLRGVFTATAASLRKLLRLSSHPSIKPKLTYTAAIRLDSNDGIEEIGALIPCHSLWDSQGCRLSAVSIFETRAAKTK
ncbi:hypothetical protein E0Z10_g4693 [Xylaria hypoxylon]|uniref:Diphthine--ammonia ligase n=1 Tax=Xylaria hypoxylon TaxID=37992 RepID=A0A4Z0YXB5_9PEZI|nr:hypothetical protein E0Z10_g4693 [Xylaria hypoxylon]